MTHRQRDLLRFIATYQAEHHGVSPSFEEMRVELELSSKSGIHRLLDGLERQGFIRRQRYFSRDIVILKHPLDVPREVAAPPITRQPSHSDGVIELPLYRMTGPFGLGQLLSQDGS